MSVVPLKKTVTETARDIRRLSPYMLGRTLRRWYLRKLYEHHVASARYQYAMARHHTENATYYVTLATLAKAELMSRQG